MKKFRKLILSLVLLAATAVTFASTTFAFVFLQTQTEIDEFDVKLECEESLLISIDGVNFASTITEEEIKAHIAGSIEEFDKRKYNPVTPQSTAENKIAFDADGNVLFDIQSENGFVQASNTAYIKFDVWFKPISSQESKTNYALKLSDETYFKSESVEVELMNRLVSGDTTYNAGDTITIDTSNAMRLGAIKEGAVNEMLIYELPNDKNLGSAAIEGKTDDLHDPSKNAMFTYYNSMFPEDPFLEAAPDSEAYQTIGFTSEENHLATFEPNAKGEYDAKKVTIYIWLEGWDADYFFGIPNLGKNISVKLVFKMEN